MTSHLDSPPTQSVCMGQGGDVGVAGQGSGVGEVGKVEIIANACMHICKDSPGLDGIHG